MREWVEKASNLKLQASGKLQEPNPIMLASPFRFIVWNLKFGNSLKLEV